MPEGRMTRSQTADLRERFNLVAERVKFLSDTFSDMVANSATTSYHGRPAAIEVRTASLDLSLHSYRTAGHTEGRGTVPHDEGSSASSTASSGSYRDKLRDWKARMEACPNDEATSGQRLNTEPRFRQDAPWFGFGRTRACRITYIADDPTERATTTAELSDARTNHDRADGTLWIAHGRTDLPTNLPTD